MIIGVPKEIKTHEVQGGHGARWGEDPFPGRPVADSLGEPCLPFEEAAG